MSYRKLGRNSAARKALFTSILTSFFRYGRIETTEAKAKELRKFADKLITLACIGVAVVVYAVLLLALGAVERDDVLLLPKGEKK